MTLPPPSLPHNGTTAHGYGFDEAGRGCLAGPVVASVVFFSEKTDWNKLAGLDDSKKLNEKKRNALVPLILSEAKAYGIGLSWQGEVDEINIINATFRAMCRAFICMHRKSPFIANVPVYIDGNLLIRESAWQACASIPPTTWHTAYFPPLCFFSENPAGEDLPQSQDRAKEEGQGAPQKQKVQGVQVIPQGIPFSQQQAVIGGDGLIASISAASILAKTTRDSLMNRLDSFFPLYGFAKHKGYGTKHHREALLEHGPCPLHRRSFIQKIFGQQRQLSFFS